ncbi:MAG: hypothetical protein IT260_00425 [Saprospiraceae bacterium]|nr:hypothetical protein [Saprospiraceae bacterium]
MQLSEIEQIFVKEIGKSVVGDVLPSKASIYDDVAEYYLHEYFDTNTQKPSHLSSDTLLYILLGLQFIWPYLLKSINRATTRHFSQRDPFGFFEEIREAAGALPPEEIVILHNLLTGFFRKSNLTQSEVSDILISLGKNLLGRTPGEYAKIVRDMVGPMDRNRVQVVILTPKQVEYDAVRKRLDAPEYDMRSNFAWETGQFTGLHHAYDITIRLTGAQNTTLAAAAKDAVYIRRPHLIFLNGFAAGIKDVRIGDLVVATEAYGYEYSKVMTTGQKSRPKVRPYNPFLVEWARRIDRENNWRKRTEDGAVNAAVFFGPIASGEKVLSTTDSDTYRTLKNTFEDTVALEMESIGFAVAMSDHPEIKALNIRGISDMIDEKSDDHQNIASERAAAFLFELLFQLKIEDLNPRDPQPNGTSGGLENPKKTAVVGNSLDNTRRGELNLKKLEPIIPEIEDLRNIYSMLEKGKMETVCLQLKKYAGLHHPELTPVAILFSDRLTQLSKKTAFGTISNAEATIERNQIISGLLELLTRLSE